MTQDKPYKDRDLSDNRKPGDWVSRYSWKAWVQIITELFYLLLLLFIGLLVISDAVVSSNLNPIAEQVRSSLLGLSVPAAIAKWIGLAIAGMIGGIVYDLKWLYHSVAYNIWNRDRCLWRVCVPIISSMVSLFTGFLFASGLVPLKDELFNNVYALLGFGFVFGYFSDSVLAALQNFARRSLGTLSSDD
jgi:hypothetical protein